MTVTVNGTSFKEYRQSQRAMVREDGTVEGVRKFVIDWDDRWAVLHALKGFPHRGNDLDDFGEPDKMPGNTDLVCLSAEVEGFGQWTEGSDGEIEYPQAYVTARYGIPRYPTRGAAVNRFLEEQLDFGGEFFPVEANVYKWETDGQPVDVPVAKFVGYKKRSFVLHRVETINQPEFDAAIGKVNAVTFLGAPPEHLRFDGASASNSRGDYGPTPYVVRLEFTQRAVSWNMVFRPDTGQFEPVTPPIYGAALFNNLVDQ